MYLLHDEVLLPDSALIPSIAGYVTQHSPEHWENVLRGQCSPVGNMDKSPQFSDVAFQRTGFWPCGLRRKG